MGLLTGFAALKASGKLRKLLPYAAVAVVIALVLGLTYCSGRKAGGDAERVDQLKDQIELQERTIEANEQSADEAVNDAEVLRDQEEELEDARNVESDDRAARRLRRLCVKLWQQGGEHPACAGLDRPAGTGPPASSP